MEPVYIGVLTSVAAEILKLVPQLNSSSLVKSVVVFVVALAGTYFFGSVNPTDYVQTLIAAFATYKLLVQPVGEYVGLRTQV